MDLSRSEALAKQPASQDIGWAFVLNGAAAGLFALGFGTGSESSGFFFVIAGVLALVGWILMASGITRLAAKADDAHRVYVTCLAYEQALQEPQAAPEAGAPA